MRSLSEKILLRLVGRRDAHWDESCVAGAPLPDDTGCAGTDCASLSLTELQIGRPAVISCLEQPSSREARKLVALGVLPGVRLRLMQRYPAYVIRLGHTELAVDTAMAALIRVYSDG